MNSAKRSFQLAQICARQVSTSQAKSAAVEVPAGYSKIKTVQAKFQVNDGLPVFLKGGVFDKIMYQGTMALSLLGVGMVLKMIYDLSVPKKE